MCGGRHSGRMHGSRYCGNCGHELRTEDRFCPNWGRAAAGEPPGSRASDRNTLLAEVANSTFYGGGLRTTIRVFRDRVVLWRQPRLGRPDETTLRFEQIA